VKGDYIPRFIMCGFHPQLYALS